MASDRSGENNNANLSSTTLFVRNLPFSFDNSELEKVFSDIGPVKRCFVVKDRENHTKCRGFGYVTFALKEDAMKAKERIRHVNGRKVFVMFSNKKARHNRRGPPRAKVDGEIQRDAEGADSVVESGHINISPPSLQKSVDQPKHKPKSHRNSALNDDGRTIVLSGIPSTVNVKKLKKACKKAGALERFSFPVENCEHPTAHATYASYKDARAAVSMLMGKTFKGEVLNAVLRSKENKSLSQKSLKKSRLIVRNLPFKCSKELLTNEFSKFGEITEVVMPTKMVGKHKKKRGFAFVQFKNVFDAAQALEAMNQKEIKGRPIAVDWTLPKKKYELLKVSEEVDQGTDDLEASDDVGDDGVSMRKSADDSCDETDQEHEADDSENDDLASEISEGGEDAQEVTDDDSEGDEKLTKKKRKLRDAREGKTIFVRNLPFDASEEEICGLFENFGGIAYCKIVVDSLSGHSRGSAFVKFQEKPSAENCLKTCGENAEGDELSLRKRPLNVTLAVTKSKIPQVLAAKDPKTRSSEDKRNLYLAKEGVLTPGSEAAVGLSKSDLQRRQKAEAEKKAKLKMPHYVVSKTRLCFRNLPLHVDDKRLSEILRSVCDGKPKNVRKVRIMRNLDRLDHTGTGRSKGYGFAEFPNHEDALDVLRATNNNPKIFGPDRRPIVEFAIENSLILKKLEQRKSRSAKKLGESRDETSSQVSERQKRKREEKRSRKKRARKSEEESSNGHVNGQLELDGKNKNLSKVNDFHSRLRVDTKRVKLVKQNGKAENVGERRMKSSTIARGGGVTSRGKEKRRRTDNDEEKFEKIVEKYKTKLFGDNNKQLRISRWFE